MSNYSTVETDKAVIRVHLSDGTMKCFLVTQSQTPNAVKFMVCKKLGLDVKEFNMFGLYVVDGDSSSTSACTDVNENPFNLHVKWNAKSNSKAKFLFKRTDEPWPPARSESPVQATTPPVTDDAIASPRSYAPPESYSQQYSGSEGEPPAEQEESSYESGGGMSRGFGFGVTAQQLKSAASAQRPVSGTKAGMSAKAQSRLGLIGWMNKSLQPHGVTVSNLTTDMSDGVVFFRLLELVTHKTLKGWHTSPTNMMLKLDNLTMFLRILGYFGIKISGVSPEDIFSGNENIITAILLLMIKKYTPALQLEEYVNDATTTPFESPQQTSNYEDPNNNYQSQYQQPETSPFNNDPAMEAPPMEAAPVPPCASRPTSSTAVPTSPSLLEEEPPTTTPPVPMPASGRLPSTSSNFGAPTIAPSTTALPNASNSASTGPRHPSGINPNLGRAPSGRVRSRVVTPEEAAAAAVGNFTPLIAKAPSKFTIDPSLTPDLSALLGPPVDMPFNNPQNLAEPSLFPLAGASPNIFASPFESTPSFTLPPATQLVSPTATTLATQPPQQINPVTSPALPKVAPTAILPTTTAGLKKTGIAPGPGPAKGPLPTPANAKQVGPQTGVQQQQQPIAGAKKVGYTPAGNTPTAVPKTGLPKMAPGPPKAGMAKGALPKSGLKQSLASRPLPVPVARNEPREEMDINFVPQDAVQDSTIPAIEMDFTTAVPGSETAARAQRTRASTISNINTNVFDLDAFSDMESLLIGLADGI